MWASILHQGSIYSASVPVLWILTDLVAAQPGHAATASIMYGLQTIAEGAALFTGTQEPALEPLERNDSGDPAYEVWTREPLPASMDDVEDSGYFDAIRVEQRALLALLEHAVPVIDACTRHPTQEVATAAVAAGLRTCEVVPEAVEQLPGLARAFGNPGFDPGTWVSAAMVLGERGVDVSQHLAHSDRRQRLAAAMSPATKGDAQSVAELAAALADPEWLEREFPNGAAHLGMHLRFHVLGALLQRIEPDDVDPSVVEALCTLIRKRANKHTVDWEWGPILTWAFGERRVTLPLRRDPDPLPPSLTRTQTAVVGALCNESHLWDPTNGNAKLCFLRVQLPYSREQLLALTAAGP